jgi:hypothetical protein
MRPAALQLVGPDAPDIHARYAQHLDSATIIAALERSGGIVTAAAKSLHISRDTLYERLKVDEAVRQVLASVREKNLDLAEGQLLRMIKEGDGPSVRFFLRTVGRHRGYSERLVVEQTPEPAQRPRVDMSAALKALSPDEMMQLQAIVAKLEASARLEARAHDAGDDEGSRRRFRRAHFRGEVATSGEVEAVEAIAAPDEVEDLTATTEQLKPGDLTKPE